jgi:hypothetical protein
MSWKGFSGDEQSISQREEVFSGNAKDLMISYATKKEPLPFDDCAGLTTAVQAAIELLNGMRPERCPDELVERTIRLLCAAAARRTSGRDRRGRLFLSL